MAYIPYSSKVWGGIEMIKKTHEVYDHLNESGKMILLCPSSFLWGDSKEEAKFRKQLVEEGSIVEIIQLPDVMCHDFDREFCIIIAEKGRSQGHTTFIDARIAFKKKNVLTSYKDRIYGFWDMKVWNDLLQNNGIEQDTGLRKMVTVIL